LEKAIMRGLLFPGQGSQYIGMGKDLAESFLEAREVFQEIDESLSQNLSKIMFEGPESDLNLTENTQPALMAVSVAVVRILEKQGGIDLTKAASFMAGHSLGEYSALTAAKSFTISDCAKLLKLRGQSMQKAVPVGMGSMAAILGPTFEEVVAIAKDAAQSQICAAANDNSAGQVVISGHREAIERAIAIAGERGAKRAIQLPVSAPFHCSLMQPAADVMADALAATDIKAPIVPVVSNVTAQAVSDPAAIRDLLVQQITGMVRWRESVSWMKEQGVTEMIELGAGKVLSGLVRRIEKEVACESVGTPEGIEALILKLKG
jgi:[acyl-carrier-protein] S-malonyltransferase